MQALTSETEIHGPAPDPDERLAERVSRIARPSASAPRRRRRSSAVNERGSAFRLGWKLWLAIDIVCLALFLTVIVVWPPLSACRRIAFETGFYAGDSVEKCTRRGIAERIERADQRIKMLMRGSGR